MMQKSPYSAYDELFAEMLSYINERKEVLPIQIFGALHAPFEQADSKASQ